MIVRICCLALVAMLLWRCSPQPVVFFSDAERKQLENLLYTEPPTDSSNAYVGNADAQRLGQWLFFETSLSPAGDVACATCHIPQLAFTDGRPLSKAAQMGERHTPTVINSAHQRWFFWDGRRDSLWSQAVEPFEDPKEFASSRIAILRAFAKHAKALALYERVFGTFPDLSDALRFPPQAKANSSDPQDPAQLAWSQMATEDQYLVNRAFVNLGKALAAYQSQLNSSDSRFDRFAKGLLGQEDGDVQALNASEQRGLKLFIGDANCKLCHFGPNFSDGEFHNTGVPRRDGQIPKDPGRYDGLEVVANHPFNSASRYSDAPEGTRTQIIRGLIRDANQWGQMKTPTLREVSRTAPYMHRGQLDSLAEVVHFYNTLDRQVFAGHHREPFLQPLGLNDAQVADLVAFLKALDGRPIAEERLQQPQL